MLLLIQTHSSNEQVSAPEYAVVDLTPELAALIQAREWLFEQLQAQDRQLYILEFWDGHCDYRCWRDLFAAPDLVDELKTPTGELPEEVVDTVGYAHCAMDLQAPPPDAVEHTGVYDLDCHTMQLVQDGVQWTCLLHDVELATGLLPYHLFTERETNGESEL
jgi:hypothetical protein